MANPKTPGDVFFENYCAMNGYVETYEPDYEGLFRIKSQKKPDYVLERAGDRALVEVKHFETRAQTERLMAAPGQTMSFGGRELYGTLQGAIRQAAEEQLAPFASVGVPLVVVVTNPLHADVDFDADDVLSALFGQVSLRVDLENPGGSHMVVSGKDGAVLHEAADGTVVNRLPHLSAVVAMWGFERFPLVDVYDLSKVFGFNGVPLPQRMFDADGDSWLGLDADGAFTRLVERRGW